MKIFAFVDMHGSKKALDNIVEKGKNADVIVCAGDFTIFGQGYGLIMHILNKIGKPVLLIHGNHEDESMGKHMKHFPNCYFIHNNHFDFGEYCFIGWGGGGFAFKDKNFEKNKERLKKLCKGEKVILVTHAPPYNTKIDKVHGGHAGNKSIRHFIEEVKPYAAISGHLHECVGYDKIGKTVVINPGYMGKMIIV